MGQNKAAALASNLKPKSLDSSSPVHRWYMARFSLYNHCHFPNVYLLVLLLNGVWRDWIALEVPERAGGAGVWFFFTIHTWDLYHSLCLFSLLFFYLTRWYSPWRWWALSFFLIYMFDLTMLYTYFCYYLYAYYYISIREKYDFVLKMIWIPVPVTFDCDTFGFMLFSIIMLDLIYIPRNVPRAYHKCHFDRPIGNFNILRDPFPVITLHTTHISIHPQT